MFRPQTLVCLREGYTRQTFLHDLFAGLTVGVIALPLSMAFAIASGVSPDRGLFTAIVAGFLISLLGGSRVQVGGPTGAFVVIVYGIVQQYGYDGLVVASLMAGVLLVVMGLARFGRMIKFIPYPVTTGFTSGIALIIFSSQIKDFFGLQLERVPAGFVEQWSAYAHSAASWTPAASAVGLGSLLLLVGLRRWAPRVPGALVVIVLGALLVHLFDLPVETIGTRFGGIPNMLPAPALPAVDLETVRALVPSAFTIAFLAGIESLLSAVAADGMTGGRHNANVELIAQGVANVGSVLMGGIPATGAIARTAANVKSGGRTPVAGMIHALTLFVILLVLAPLATLVPLAAMAAILILVAWNMSEMDHFISLFRSPRSDVAVLLLTFTLTVLIDLTVAVQVGLVLAALLFMKRMSDVTNIQKITSDADDEETLASQPVDVDLSRYVIPPEVEVYEINGPFFFGVADRLKDELGSLERPPRVFILRLRHVLAIDATGLHALEELHHKCERQGTRLLLAGVHAQPLVALTRAGLDRVIGTDNLVGSFDDALARARQLLAPPVPAAA